MRTNSSVALGLALAAVLVLLPTAASAVEVALFVECDAVNLRSGAGQDQGIICTLPRGTELRVKSQRDYWREVYVPSANVTGWVAHWLLSDTPEPGVRREVKYVGADDVLLRDGPGQKYEQIGILPKGVQVDVIAYEDQWRKVRVPSNGEVGWVADWLLSGGSSTPAAAPGPTAATPTVRYINANDVCLRNGPGQDRGVITTLTAGTQVTVTQVGAKWCMIATAGGLSGYVAREYLAEQVHAGGYNINLAGPTVAASPFPTTLPPVMAQGAGVPGGGAPLLAQTGPQGGFQPVSSAGTQPSSRDPRSITANQVTVAAIPLRAEGLISDGLVNVRSGPGMGFSLVGQAAQGTPLMISGATNGWFLAQFNGGIQGWVAGWLVQTDPSIAQQGGVLAPQSSPTQLGNSIAQFALQFRGTPYVWGGKSPGGFDCSGLVYYTLNSHNISIPRTSFDQWEVGTPISTNQLIAGDLVFFANTYTSGVSHVGIYVGDGKFVHAASTGVGVIVQPLSERAKSYCGARRVY